MKKLILVFSIVFIFISLKASCQDNATIKLPEYKGDLITVRVFEQAGTFFSSKLFISDGINSEFKIELENLKPKNAAENITIITKVLSLLKKQGYKIITSSSAGGGSGAIIIITNYILQKE